MSDIISEKAPPDSCVVCVSGQGYKIEHGNRAPRKTNFARNSVGYKMRALDNGESEVLFPGAHGMYAVADNDLRQFAPAKTGKPKTGEEYENYICNICFVLKQSDQFDPNQRDSQGRVTRRPSCISCRSHMDLKSIPPREEKRWRQARPRKGSLFQCPICQKFSIAFVNANIVLDHDHVHGKIRGYLCDSCNTGLGRFKNGVNLLRNALDYIGEDD